MKEQILCCESFLLQTLSHTSHDSAALHIEMKCICFLFFSSYLYISPSHVCFDTICYPSSRHVRFVTLLNEFGCLYTLTRNVFKGHVTLKCNRRCTTTSWMWPLCANDKKWKTDDFWLCSPTSAFLSLSSDNLVLFLMTFWKRMVTYLLNKAIETLKVNMKLNGSNLRY